MVYIGKRIKLKCMRIAPVFELIKTLTAAEVKMLKQRAESPNAAFLSLLKIMVQAPTNEDRKSVV